MIIYIFPQIFYMQGLVQRVLTAIVFVVIMVGGVYLHPLSLIALFLLITAMCLWEYLDLTLSKDNSGRKWIALFLGLFPFLLTALYNSPYYEISDTFLYNGLLLFLPLVALSFVYELYTSSEKPFTNIGVSLLGVFYIGIPLALVPMIAFRAGVFHPNIIFGLLLLTWANDTGAYLIGSQIGRTKLFPRISPKKTWEGSFGGVLVAFMAAYLLSMVFKDLALKDWLVLALLVSVFGSIGDLVESMLKRSLNIKDSGNLLPGHGGMLDRFDAFLFLLPFAGAYLLWIS